MESGIRQNLEIVRNSLPLLNGVEIVAVSKFKPVEAIREAYDAGQRVFGESRVQEIAAKAPQLPADIQWHFIGHLQTNKVDALLKIPGLKLIQSVDSLKLLRYLNAAAVKLGVGVDVLLEVHVAQETTKYGFNTQELEQWMASGEWENLRHVSIRGIMGMATNTSDEERIRSDFNDIASCYRVIKQNNPTLEEFNILSMGMSGDYLIAVDEGANMVRIGSNIFGER